MIDAVKTLICIAYFYTFMVLLKDKYDDLKLLDFFLVWINVAIFSLMFPLCF